MSFRDMPAGQNTITAIACYSGYNQEDSVIMNQSAIERGLFRSSFYRTYQDKIHNSVRASASIFLLLTKFCQEEQFCKPSRETSTLRRNNYDKMDADGLIPPGVMVTGADIVIGKTTNIPHREDGPPQRFTKRDVSTCLRPSEVGVVDQVLVTVNEEGYRLIKVKVRSQRVPQIGDKFSSRSKVPVVFILFLTLSTDTDRRGQSG
jgi:DNA-directed RNA polymerase II subunit RPB2